MLVALTYEAGRLVRERLVLLGETLHPDLGYLRRLVSDVVALVL